MEIATCCRGLACFKLLPPWQCCCSDVAPCVKLIAQVAADGPVARMQQDSTSRQVGVENKANNCYYRSRRRCADSPLRKATGGRRLFANTLCKHKHPRAPNPVVSQKNSATRMKPVVSTLGTLANVSVCAAGRCGPHGRSRSNSIPSLSRSCVTVYIKMSL